MATLHRTQVLLEPEQHQALAQISRQRDRSISDLVREAVHQYLKQIDEEVLLRKELEAIEKLTHLRKRLETQYGLLDEENLLAIIRDERDEELESVMRGEV